MALTDFLGELAGHYKDIEVAKASKNGADVQGSRVESIPDQTAIGKEAPTGPIAAPVNAGSISIGGLQLNKSALVTTGVVLAGLAALKWVKS